MKARHYPLLFLIAFVGLLAYSNSFAVPFQFDDYANIVDNPTIRSLNYFISSFDASGFNGRRFIGYLTFALNYSMGGLNTVGYHAVNLAIHILNAILVYFLVVLTFRIPCFSPQGGEAESKGQRVEEKRQNSALYALCSMPPAQFIALFAALLFVAHPIQTQAVTYIVQRFTSLATLFYLLSVVMYIKGRLKMLSAESMAHSAKDSTQGTESKEQKGGNAMRYALGPMRLFRGPMPYALCSLLSAVLAMKTKEIAFTLPVTILLYEFVFFKPGYKKRRLFLIVVSAAVIVIPLLLINLGGLHLSELAKQTKVQAEGPRWVYFLTEMRVIVTYVRLIFLPINQNIDYGYEIFHSFFDLPVILSFLFLSAVFLTAVWLLYKTQRAECKALSVENSMPYAPYNMRLAAFGIFWFFITLSVESSLIPIADVIFEHRVYLPSVGMFIALTSAAFAANEKLPAKAQKAVIAGLIAAVTLLGGATYMRNKVWQSHISLWEDAAEKSPGNVRPIFTLAAEYAKVGKYEKAIELYRKALAVPPGEYLNLRANEYPKIYNSLGLLYSRLGRYDKAIEIFNMIPEIDPDFLDAYNNMGAAYINSGRYAEAIAPLKRVIEKNPDHLDAHYNLSMAYLAVGDRDEAVKEYVILKRLSPELAAELYGRLAGAR